MKVFEIRSVEWPTARRKRVGEGHTRSTCLACRALVPGGLDREMIAQYSCAVLAFIKRHRIRLGCLLLACLCSVVSVAVAPFYIWRGYVCLIFKSNSAAWQPLMIHEPVFGGAPLFYPGSDFSAFGPPVWLVLAAILGWIIFREVRWREKRAKSS
jgi:hypothetical protein